MEEDIKILEDFKNNSFQKDKLERNEKGGFKIGTIYKTTELNPAIENLINKYKELEKERDSIYADYQDLGKDKLKLEEKCVEQEKMIELMSRTMHYICLFRSQSKYVIRKYCKIYNSGNIGECEGLICSECVANYFRKKAR